MAQPLIYGSVGPKGGDYQLKFKYESPAYTLRTPFTGLGGSALGALSGAFAEVGDNVSFFYRVGGAMSAQGTNGALEVNPLFTDGAEMTLRYAGGASGQYDVALRVRPNSDIYRSLYIGTHGAAASGELEVRVACTLTSTKVYVGGVLVSEVDPRSIDWGWATEDMEGAPYWMYLEVGAPFDRYADLDGLVSTDGDWRYFLGSAVSHIREITYGLPSTLAPSFFRDFVKAYEVVGEAVGGNPSQPPVGPGQPDDLSNDTILVLDAQPDPTGPTGPMIVVGSLPFRATLNYRLGGEYAHPAFFQVDLSAGTYKFSTLLSPDPLDHDTSIALYSLSSGALVHANDDIEGTDITDNRSEIRADLPAGQYMLVVSTNGTEFTGSGITTSSAIDIPAGTVVRISKV